MELSNSGSVPRRSLPPVLSPRKKFTNLCPRVSDTSSTCHKSLIILISRPVSSNTSRIAASAEFSPSSIPPPGTIQISLPSCICFTIRMFPSSSGTITLTPPVHIFPPFLITVCYRIIMYRNYKHCKLSLCVITHTNSPLVIV